MKNNNNNNNNNNHAKNNNNNHMEKKDGVALSCNNYQNFGINKLVRS